MEQIGFVVRRLSHIKRAVRPEVSMKLKQHRQQLAQPESDMVEMGFTVVNGGARWLLVEQVGFSDEREEKKWIQTEYMWGIMLVCVLFFGGVFGRMIGLGVYELWMEFEVKLRG